VTEFHDLMIDVESAGKGATGALMSIGAVFFNYTNECVLGPTFNKVIHLATSVRDGGTMDPSTFLWWMRQSQEARFAVAFGGGEVREVLAEFTKFIEETSTVKDVRPWGNSPKFDMQKIEHAYKGARLPVPWHFTNERCFRTVRCLHAHVVYDPKEKGTGNHNALDDAIFQAKHLFKIRNYRKAPNA